MKKILAAALALTLGVSAAAEAATYTGPGILGARVTAKYTGNIAVTYLGKITANLISQLYLKKADGSSVLLFDNSVDPVGKTINIGSYTAGQLLNFYIIVSPGTRYPFTWSTGAASNNVDNKIHAVVEELANDVTKLGFEDIYNGGDADYNDVMFQFSNTYATPIPVPAGGALLATGLVGLAALRRRRKA